MSDSYPLFRREASLYFQHGPICTVTFFEGSYQNVKNHITESLQEILNKNAWLGGKLVKVKKEIHLACSSNANIKNWRRSISFVHG